jgi:hypothetical protein
MDSSQTDPCSQHQATQARSDPTSSQSNHGIQAHAHNQITTLKATQASQKTTRKEQTVEYL